MRDEKLFTVYIVTNTRRGVLYVGMTSNLIGRVGQHREGAIPGFTRDWGLKRLVWYETIPEANAAITFEKKLKRWRREWKFNLIEKTNPEWEDLWPTLIGDDGVCGGPGQPLRVFRDDGQD